MSDVIVTGTYPNGSVKATEEIKDNPDGDPKRTVTVTRYGEGVDLKHRGKRESRRIQRFYRNGTQVVIDEDFDNDGDQVTSRTTSYYAANHQIEELVEEEFYTDPFSLKHYLRKKRDGDKLVKDKEFEIDREGVRTEIP